MSNPFSLYSPPPISARPTILQPAFCIKSAAIEPTFPKPCTTTRQPSLFMPTLASALSQQIMTPRPVASRLPREPPSSIGLPVTTAVGAPKRNIHDRALPGHPSGQRAHFVKRNVGGETNPAFSRPAHVRMQHTVAGENFQLPVVHAHRNVQRDFFARPLQEAIESLLESPLVPYPSLFRPHSWI